MKKLIRLGDQIFLREGTGLTYLGSTYTSPLLVLTDPHYLKEYAQLLNETKN